MAPAHLGSPPRKRMMLAGGQSADCSRLRSGMMEGASEQPLSLNRPQHGMGGLQQLGGHSTSKHGSKRERTSNGGDAAATAEVGAAGSGAVGSQPAAPPSFTITVDCRAAADSTATALWQRMHMLEIRNKQLEQQLVEQMQATQITCSSTSTSSSSSMRQPHSAVLPPAPQQADRSAPSPLVSPRAHAELLEAEPPVAMDVEPVTSTSTAAAAAAAAASIEAAAVGTSSRQMQQQQRQQRHSDAAMQRQQQQQQPHVGDDAAPQQLVYCLRQQVQKLEKDLQRQQQLNSMLTSDNADLEAVLKETERQRREFAARYAFMTLDTDGDGYVSVEQVLTYDLFSCYAPSVLMAAFSVWRWDSGFPGYLCMDDFVRFVEYAEDRSTRESQRFWFSVMDADGDGRLSWADMKLLYDAVHRSCTAQGGILLHFEDLMNQVRDMVSKQRHPSRGFTAQELWESKLGAGVIGLLTNANNMLLQRSTAEWGRGDFPL